jgi:hypothetical protein
VTGTAHSTGRNRARAGRARSSRSGGAASVNAAPSVSRAPRGNSRTARFTLSADASGVARSSSRPKAGSAEASSGTNNSSSPAVRAAATARPVVPAPRSRAVPRPAHGSARGPAQATPTTAAVIARSERPGASESAPVSVAVTAHSTNSQPAARTVPTASRASVTRPYPPCRTVIGRSAAWTTHVSAAVVATPATSQPTPGRSRVNPAATAVPPTPVATSAAGPAAPVGPGQRRW